MVNDQPHYSIKPGGCQLVPDKGLLLDEETHMYTLNGLFLPSVTAIMRPMSLLLYDGVSGSMMSMAADRGTRAHEQVSNIIRYGIYESDEDTRGYIEAFTAFLEDHKGIEFVGSEFRTYHKRMRYAGTIDSIAYVDADSGEGVDVIDLKCTASYHGVMLETQVCAYREALESHGIKTRAGYGLQLLKSGEYHFEKLGNDGYKTFLHSMAITNAMASELLSK